MEEKGGAEGGGEVGMRCARGRKQGGVEAKGGRIREQDKSKIASRCNKQKKTVFEVIGFCYSFFFFFFGME